MTYLITKFVLTTTTKTAVIVRGKKKVMEEEAKQETYYEASKIYIKKHRISFAFKFAKIICILFHLVYACVWF